MKVFIVYAHPGEDSFTRHVRDRFIAGLESAGHSYILSDLYRTGFRTDMSGEEYFREAHYRRDLPVPEDVAAEQGKINASDAIVFIYPVFWSDAPAKLTGWFDRVWTYGFAYGNSGASGPQAGGPPEIPRTMKQLEKGLVLCTAGNSMAYFNETGLLEAMKKVMLGDRLFDRVKYKEMIVLDGTSREMESRQANWEKHLAAAYEAGRLIGAVPDRQFCP